MAKLAICVPTYNRADVIEELIIRRNKLYYDEGFDLYIYDSSENDATKNIFDKYHQKYSNLFYKRINSSVHSNMKVYMIYQDFQSNGKYDYLWVSSDAIRYSDDAIGIIKKYLTTDYDLIVINNRDEEKLGLKEYNDYNEFFSDCAWQMTLYGATIVKIATLLNNVNWSFLIEKYMVSDKINFSHVAFYFEQIYKLGEFRGLHLSINKNDFTASPLRQQSGWYKDTFYVWCTCWPNTIYALPECYIGKDDVIRKHGIYSGILTLRNLVQLRENNIFNYNIYEEYKKQWRKLTDVNPFLIFILSLIPIKLVHTLFLNSMKERKFKKDIKRFCDDYDKIYIYGCGLKSNIVANHLDELNINYEGFLVSEISNEKKKFRDHDVMEFDLSILKDNNVGIIIGMNKKNYESIKNLFGDREYRKKIFYNDLIEGDIR